MRQARHVSLTEARRQSPSEWSGKQPRGCVSELSGRSPPLYPIFSLPIIFALEENASTRTRKIVFAVLFANTELLN
ncbi:hypothetical protein MTO96_027475 [Rhipicephalus appendiculatus]